MEPNDEVRLLDHRIVAVAAIGSLTPITSVYTDVGDPDCLRALADDSKVIGSVRQSAIRSDQISVINNVITPSTVRVEQAR